MKSKLILSVLLVSSIIFFSFTSKTKIDPLQPVNSVIGDISFEKKFGHNPDKSSDENLRISTHLEYVEELLRNADVSSLTPTLIEKRKHLIALLHNYRIAGIFPRNFDYMNQRNPCFIDKDGRICAVGYLIEQTSGRSVAEQINSKHKYDRITEMNNENVNEWVNSSGLTLQECAMIQPTYGPPPVYTENYISPSYGISSSIWCGANIAFGAIDVVQLTKGTDKKILPVIGMLSGAGQIAFGIGNLPEEEVGMYVTTNESQKVMSMMNIGIGTSTLILSTWNLIANRNYKPKTTSWNFMGIPGKNDVTLAFSFAKRF